MRKIHEGAIYRIVSYILEKEFAHFLAGRYTQGFVTKVNTLGSVQVQRLGETAPDGTDWICAVPGYIPQVGDRVELVWADDTYGYVAFPLAMPQVGLPRLAYASGRLAGGWPTTQTFTTVYAKSSLVVSASATCWATAGPQQTALEVDIDGVLLGLLSMWFNETLTHKALPPLFAQTSGTSYAAGSHTVTLKANTANIGSDVGDSASFLIWEIPIF